MRSLKSTLLWLRWLGRIGPFDTVLCGFSTDLSHFAEISWEPVASHGTNSNDTIFDLTIKIRVITTAACEVPKNQSENAKQTTWSDNAPLKILPCFIRSNKQKHYQELVILTRA